MSQDRKDRVITGSASTSGLVQTQFISGSKAITKYINLVSRNNKRTAYEYFFRLKRFEHFFKINYDFSLDEFLTSNDNSKKLDIYEVLNGFVSYLIDKGTYTNGSIKQRVNTARNLL